MREGSLVFDDPHGRGKGSRMRRGIGLSLLSVLLSFQVASAMTSVVSHQCPERYVAEVTQVIEEEVSTTLPKVKILLRTEEVIAGDVSEVEEISILKNGPVSVEQGDIIEIHARNGRLCLLQKEG